MIARWIAYRRYNKYNVERVYIYGDNMVEFVFSNKIRRKLKDTEESHLFMKPQELTTPSLKDGRFKGRGFELPKEFD